MALLAGLVADVARRSSVAGAAGGPPTRIITYEVRGWDNVSDIEQFAAAAAENYADPRGWSFGGSVAFVRVPSGGNFTLWLSAAPRTFRRSGRRATRATPARRAATSSSTRRGGSPAHPHGTRPAHRSTDYRHMVLNHETGHWIGFGHQLCGGPGQLAPVMQQQSISLQGCLPNPWPLPSELAAAGGPARGRDPARRARRCGRLGAALVARRAREGLGDRPGHHRPRHRAGHRRRHAVLVPRGAAPLGRRGRIPGLRAEPRLRRRGARGQRLPLRLHLRGERRGRRWQHVARAARPSSSARRSAPSSTCRPDPRW